MFQAKCVLASAKNVNEGPGLLLDLLCLFNSINNIGFIKCTFTIKITSKTYKQLA